MKRTLSLAFALFLLLLLSAPGSAQDRVVLTIGDRTTRSGTHFDENLGIWQYLAEKVGVEIQYVYLTQEEYSSALANGSLPDLVATQNDLSTILEYGVALDADPYLEEFVPNLLQGDARLTYDVFKQLGELEGDGGFYFFPARIGYNGVGFDNETSTRGYVVRWDYYKELGYPPVKAHPHRCPRLPANLCMAFRKWVKLADSISYTLCLSGCSFSR